MKLYKVPSAMTLLFIIVISYFNGIYSESMTNQIWSDIIQDLSSKIHNDKLHSRTKENPPLQEGFMLLSGIQKKISPSLTPSNSTELIIFTRMASTYNISSTTCKTTTMVDDTNRIDSPKIDRIDKRSLDDANYVDNADQASTKSTMETDDEIESFLQVDPAELSKELFRAATYTEGSGPTDEPTTEAFTSESTVTQISTINDVTTQSTTTVSDSTTESTAESSTAETAQTTVTPRSSTTTVILPSPTTTTRPVISNVTELQLSVPCVNASDILRQMEENFTQQFHKFTQFLKSPDSTTVNTSNCSPEGTVPVNWTIITDDDVSIVNDIFEVIDRIKPPSVSVIAKNLCGDDKEVPIKNVDACFIIKACKYCGSPPRGNCEPEFNVTKCKCYENSVDPSRPYRGEFCLPEDLIGPPKTGNGPNWTPIIVGIVAGVTGLFCAVTCCLWFLAAWRRRRPKNDDKDDSSVSRLWHLPRAQVPTPGANPNTSSNPANSTPTLNSDATDSDLNPSDASDSTFFKDLDQKMGENLRATRTRPNSNALLASLPPDTVSTLSSHDPIEELDAIIDNEDLDLAFHDPLNDLFDLDDELLEAINPNIQLPTANDNSIPSGRF